MRSVTLDRGAIHIALVEREGGGWDISNLTFKGHNVLKDRKGEFETGKEAEAAAMERAESFAREHGYLK